MNTSDFTHTQPTMWPFTDELGSHNTKNFEGGCDLSHYMSPAVKELSYFAILIVTTDS